MEYQDPETPKRTKPQPGGSPERVLSPIFLAPGWGGEVGAQEYTAVTRVLEAGGSGSQAD